MALKLYAHPFSSYCQKVFTALYENDTSFEFRVLAPNDERARSELEALWPLKRFPVPADGNRTVARAVDEARPYRSLFPLGAPDRD